MRVVRLKIPRLLTDPFRRHESPERVTLYRLPLECKAAPGIGCGVRAKNILLELERNPAVAQAWLNRSGSIVAVVWSEHSVYENRTGVMRAVLQKNRLAPTELRGEVRKRAVEDFLSGGNWYRGAAVDRLSKEEANVIAARIVRRLRARVPLSMAQATTLKNAFAGACKQELIRSPARSAQARRIRIAKAIPSAGHKHLAENGMSALQEVIAPGHRPLPGEQ